MQNGVVVRLESNELRIISKFWANIEQIQVN